MKKKYDKPANVPHYSAVFRWKIRPPAQNANHKCCSLCWSSGGPKDLLTLGPFQGFRWENSDWRNKNKSSKKTPTIFPPPNDKRENPRENKLPFMHNWWLCDDGWASRRRVGSWEMVHRSTTGGWNESITSVYLLVGLLDKLTYIFCYLIEKNYFQISKK